MNWQDFIGGKSKCQAGSSWAKATFSSSLNSEWKLKRFLDEKKMGKNTFAIALFSFLTLEIFPTASLAQTVSFSNSGRARQDSTVIGNNNNVTQNINIINNFTQPRSDRKLDKRFNPVTRQSIPTPPQYQGNSLPSQYQANPLPTRSLKSI